MIRCTTTIFVPKSGVWRTERVETSSSDRPNPITLNRTLEERTVGSEGETDDNAYGLPVAGEGNHLDDFRQIASFLPVLPIEILGELKKGGLGLGPDESELLGLWVDVLGGGGVDCDRLIDQVLELGGKDRVDIALLDREVVGVFPVDLGFVGGLGHILFLWLILVLVRRVRAGFVVLEIANEFGVDTNRAGNDAHDVLGEGPSFVGADDRSVGHGLARAKNAD